MDPDLPPWSAALQRMLAKRGLTGSEVSRRMGYHRPSPVLAWLRGDREPGIVNVLAMLEAMGADLAELQEEMNGASRRKQ